MINLGWISPAVSIRFPRYAFWEIRASRDDEHIVVNAHEWPCHADMVLGEQWELFPLKRGFGGGQCAGGNQAECDQIVAHIGAGLRG